MEHYFNIDLATKLGIEEAIFLHNLYYWIQKNAVNKKQFYDGSYWTYNTKQAYAELFPYMSLSKIKRIIDKLLEECIIKKGNYSNDKMNRTSWYAFTECGLRMMENAGYKIGVFRGEENCVDALGQNEPMQKPESEQCTTNINNTDINNKETLETSSRVKERLSHKYNKDKPLTDIEVKYYLGMEEKYPRVMRMDEPLLYKQYIALLNKGVNVNKIKANLEAMNNNKKIRERYNAYLTLLNYIKIDKNTYAPTMA